MLIDIDSPMRIAAQNGVRDYQPAFRGQALKVENEIPAHSEANLNLLLSEGLQVASIRVVESGARSRRLRKRRVIPSDRLRSRPQRAG